MRVHVSKTGHVKYFPAGSTARIAGISDDDMAAFRSGAIVVITGCKPTGGRTGDTFRVMRLVGRKPYPRVATDMERDAIRSVMEVAA